MKSIYRIKYTRHSGSIPVYDLLRYEPYLRNNQDIQLTMLDWRYINYGIAGPRYAMIGKLMNEHKFNPVEFKYYHIRNDPAFSWMQLGSKDSFSVVWVDENNFPFLIEGSFETAYSAKQAGNSLKDYCARVGIEQVRRDCLYTYQNLNTRGAVRVKAGHATRTHTPAPIETKTWEERWHEGAKKFEVSNNQNG